MRDWNIRLVEPIGTEEVFALVNPGGCRMIDMPVYPEETRRDGERLRSARAELRIGLREASRRLGLSAVELSACERGSMTGDVDAMIAELRRGGSDA